MIDLSLFDVKRLVVREAVRLLRMEGVVQPDAMARRIANEACLAIAMEELEHRHAASTAKLADISEGPP